MEKIWFEIWAHTKHPHHPNPTHQPRTKRQANTPPSKVPCFFKNNVYLSVCEGTILTRERQKKDGMLILSPTQQGYSHVAGNGDVHSGAQNRTAPIS